MADGHEGHGHGPGEACHDSAHDHDASWERGAEMSLYRVVDVPRARALNTADPTHVPIFKPWDQRLDVLKVRAAGRASRHADAANARSKKRCGLAPPTAAAGAIQFVESDTDDQLIIHVPYADDGKRAPSLLARHGSTWARVLAVAGRGAGPGSPRR